MADPETISYQTQQVTTEVFPSEMGEGEIPWWVWLLAALLGLLLLAIITLCLYKVSTTLESDQDFLIKLDMKPCMHLVEISIFSPNLVIIRPTKSMNRADKNWAQF